MIVIETGTVLTMYDARQVYFGGHVALDGDRIAAVGPGRYPGPVQAGDEVIDAAGMAVLPGLVDLHFHSAVGKGYCDHLPLYRQVEIYARAGVELDRSTLADWVGQTARLVRPLVEAVGAHVMAAERVHADDTTVPVLDPGRGKTKTGRLWCYARDDRAFAGNAAPAVRYHYSADRKAEHPQALLVLFRGILQADGYAGYARLFDRGVTEAACWAHARRKFFELADIAANARRVRTPRRSRPWRWRRSNALM